LTPIEVAQKLQDEALVAVLQGATVEEAVANDASRKEAGGRSRKERKKMEKGGAEEAASVDDVDIDLLLS